MSRATGGDVPQPERASGAPRYTLSKEGWRPALASDLPDLQVVRLPVGATAGASGIPSSGTSVETRPHDSQRTQGETRRETPLERLDRNLEELTGELRVVVTGVQVLFAFLLIVPFNVGFAHIGDFERTVYFVTLVLAALAALCTLAPSAEHRFLFRHDDKRHIVFSSNRVVIAGLAFLALAMCGCLLLVTTKLFGVTAGALTASISAIPFALLWFIRPIARLRKLDAEQRERRQHPADIRAAGPPKQISSCRGRVSAGHTEDERSQ
jgi:hypothetical protein